MSEQLRHVRHLAFKWLAHLLIPIAIVTQSQSFGINTRSINCSGVIVSAKFASVRYTWRKPLNDAVVLYISG
jgi:hypothetical protein